MMMMTPAKKRVLSGVKPTNQLTLGNYLGALKNWVAFQDRQECFFLVVDLHAITIRKDPKELREETYSVLASYLAAGIDVKKSVLFLQSHVPAHAQLAWILNCFSSMGELGRMTQYKDKSKKEGQNIPVGIFTYPLLMAADILLYDAHQVPVGEDQKQHIELTREVAERMNNYYGKNLFVIPEPSIPPHGARIMDLQNPEMKMGKSESGVNGAVFLMDTEQEIRNKIKRAVTDSGSEITWDDQKPGIKNLLMIQAAITGTDPKKLIQQYEGKQYGHLKVETAEVVASTLKPIREEITKHLADVRHLDQILKKGADRANAIAESTLERVYEAVGFVPTSR